MKSIKFIGVLMLLFACTHVDAAKSNANEVEPDYTKGANSEGQSPNPWALGATGAFGNIWHGDQRMIQISGIAQGSPAAGKLKECDVILGVISPKVSPGPSIAVDEKCRRPECGAPGKTGNCGHFTWEARRTMSAAITEAEKTDGKLVLNVWRPETESVPVPPAPNRKNDKPKTKLVLKQPISAKIEQVTLTLPKKGTFSATSPWKCEKTEVLINDAAQAIVKRGLNGGIYDDINALGLLATGDEKYLPMVRDYVRKKAKGSEEFDIMEDRGIGSWQGGYQNILMTEYYLLTKDESVLPGIKALSEYMSYGQSGVGTWSHGMAYIKQNGMYGPSAAYGAMNAASLPIAISLVLAQKCGITTQPVNDAVKRSQSFYRFYVDKGTIPYGEHPPAFNYDGNGKNSMAAVFFDLIGDKESTKYFARMTLASSNDREGGHTGHFFAWQWGAPGASRGGPLVSQAFVRNTLWFTELERRSDGSSVYQYQLKGDHHKYSNWETTGQRLIQHCLPRKVLYLTGKVDSCVTPFTAAEVKEVLDAATFKAKGLPVKDLLAALGNWSLLVRQSAASELGTREDNLVEELIAMLDSPNRYARYGAATALSSCGRNSEKAVDKLIEKITNDKDLTMRYFAVNALKLPEGKPSPNALGFASRKAVPVLLKIAATYDPEQDPNRMISGQMAGMFLYRGQVRGYAGFFPEGKGTENLDRELFFSAMKAWLVNPDGGVRSEAATVYDDLKEEDLNQLWPEIYYATKYQAPANAMFAGGVRAAGFKLMSNRAIKEAIPLGIDYTLRQDGWGHGGRVADRPMLLKYGKALESYVPEIETVLAEWEAGKSHKNRPKDAKPFREQLADALAKPAPELKSINSFLDAADIKDPVKVFPPNKDGSPRKVVLPKEENNQPQDKSQIQK